MATRTLPNTCSLLSSGKASSLAYTVYAADGTVSQNRVYGQMTEDGTSGNYSGPAIVVADTLAGYIRYDHSGTADAAGTPIPVENFAAQPSTDSIAAAIFAYVTEGTTTFAQAVRGMSAALMGAASGLQLGGTPRFRDLANTKDRITAVVDSNGNRSFVTRDLD
jgi:hypothetical protein